MADIEQTFRDFAFVPVATKLHCSKHVSVTHSNANHKASIG